MQTIDVHPKGIQELYINYLELKLKQTLQILTATYTNNYYQKTRRSSHGFYMNWMYSPGIQDHITYQNQLSSLMKQTNYYKTQGKAAYPMK